MKYKSLPSQETLRHYFDYNPNTGVFVWKNSKSPKVKPGDTAGTTDKQGYRIIRVEGNLYKAHRLAWVYVYGEDPADKVIDHINCVTNDNRISNLRLVTDVENRYNQPKAKGYSYHKRDDCYQAYIGANGVLKHLGYHDTPEEAHKAYLDAKQQLHTIS